MKFGLQATIEAVGEGWHCDSVGGGGWVVVRPDGTKMQPVWNSISEARRRMCRAAHVYRVLGVKL